LKVTNFTPIERPGQSPTSCDQDARSPICAVRSSALNAMRALSAPSARERTAAHRAIGPAVDLRTRRVSFHLNAGCTRSRPGLRRAAARIRAVEEAVRGKEGLFEASRNKADSRCLPPRHRIVTFGHQGAALVRDIPQHSSGCRPRPELSLQIYHPVRGCRNAGPRREKIATAVLPSFPMGGCTTSCSNLPPGGGLTRRSLAPFKRNRRRVPVGMRDPGRFLRTRNTETELTICDPRRPAPPADSLRLKRDRGLREERICMQIDFCTCAACRPDRETARASITSRRAAATSTSFGPDSGSVPRAHPRPRPASVSKNRGRASTPSYRMLEARARNAAPPLANFENDPLRAPFFSPRRPCARRQRSNSASRGISEAVSPSCRWLSRPLRPSAFSQRVAAPTVPRRRSSTRNAVWPGGDADRMAEERATRDSRFLTRKTWDWRLSLGLKPRKPNEFKNVSSKLSRSETRG